ncbi:sperm-associated antigen 1 [Puntigrus tetrazona]|uniref:sperm-associated antigen 1 n=1 Tax=Puntigrus tetrazona TaxID=1606681 RepID=UPI001C8AC517|nr:sperm-associated antigen 1 [Puntigrus tetrazona]
MSSAEGSAPMASGSSCRSVPVEHLDYSFIQSCSDLKHLEQILRVLRSGQEGFYPHLIEFCEKHIEKLDPRSRVLRKEKRAASAASFSTEEWRSISEDLQLWESSVRLRDAELKRRTGLSEAGDLPPVRSSNLLQRKVSAAVRTERRSCVPRSYRDWDRFDVEVECNSEDEDSVRSSSHACICPVVPETTPQVSSTGQRSEKLLMDETETSSTGRKILIQEVEADEDAQDESSGTESGIMGSTQKTTNEPTNDSSSRGGGPTAEHTQTGPAHQRKFLLLKDDGNALVRRGCYQEAVDRYTHCLQLRPLECAVYTNRALCYIKLQRFTEAQQDCDSALQLQPTNKKAFYRRALANKGLKDYEACRSDLQQVLCLDASVTEAEQLLTEVTRLMRDSRCSSGPRRSVTITEVDDDDDDGGGGEDEGISAVIQSVSLRWSNTFEFGQALNSALSGGDLLTCADLLRCVASEQLPQLIGTQLDGHTLGFILRALNTHLLHTHPELVFQHLQQLQTARRFTMVLMLLDAEDRSHLSQIFQKLQALQTQAFSQNDITNLANKYL